MTRPLRQQIGIVFIAVYFLIPVPARSQQWSENGNNIYNTNSGSVGIGTSSPAQKLDISGNMLLAGDVAQYRVGIGSSGTQDIGIQLLNYGRKHGGIRFSGDQLIIEDASYSSVPSTWYQGQSLDFIIRNGKVGIGTTSPQTPLHVYSNSTYGALILQSGSSASYAPRVYLQDDRSGGRTWQVDSGAYAGQFSISDNTAGLTRLTINSSGNVGIGVTNPSSKLHVDGDVTVTGNISAKYQDIAEWVATSQSLSNGSVVALAPGKGNSITQSTTPYDTRVAGVVSANPGIILGEAGEGKVRVATTGRVKVRVDASAAPIEVGDLLVTSSKEGMAMKSEPVSVGGIEMHRPGTLIGKALESLSEGEGEILVLLSLQ